MNNHPETTKHHCDSRGHQMRIFGGGHLNGSNGKYPSTKVCDEIEGKSVIMVERAGIKEKALWEQMHDTINIGWKREFIKYDPPGSKVLG